MASPVKTNCTGYRHIVSRRDFLQSLGGGLGAIAFADMLRAEGSTSATGKTHHRPTAKRVLLLFMSAGVSHVDTYDYKPELKKHESIT